MNFFFGINNNLIESSLTIPFFKNNDTFDSDYKVFKLKIINNAWSFNEVINYENNTNFQKISHLNNEDIYFLAKQKQLLHFNNQFFSEIENLNDYTDTEPAYRANLEIENSFGGFSSYQSEYPFEMIKKEGSILSPLSMLLNKDADQNMIFFRNIYYKPIRTYFDAYIIDKKKKIIVKKLKFMTNYSNCAFIDKSLINSNYYLFTKNYLGIPLFISMKNGYLSFEHTHPPHEYLLGKDRFLKIKKLKKIFNEIVN